MRKNIIQGHLTFEKEPALTQVPVPRHTSVQVAQVQKISTRHRKNATNRPSASVNLKVFPESVVVDAYGSTDSGVPSASTGIKLPPAACHLMLALADPVLELISYLLCLRNRVLEGKRILEQNCTLNVHDERRRRHGSRGTDDVEGGRGSRAS